MMLVTFFVTCLIWANSIVLATITSPDATIRTRDPPGLSSADTLRAFRRAVAEISRREISPVFSNRTSFEKSWDGATLFSYHETSKKGNATVAAGVDIVCASCYLKAKATAELSIDKSFNTSAAFHNLTKQVSTQFDNATDTAVEWVGDYVKNTFVNLKDGIDWDDFAPPPIDVDFNIAIPHMPECRLKFNFDGLELYMLLDSKLSAGVTYHLNMYSSNTPIGISAGKELDIGVIFSVDLVLTADAEVHMQSGFHIKLDDGASFSLAMFADNLTDTTFKGGKFEFLPVTVRAAGGVLKAVLRLGVHAGVNVKTPETGIPGLEASAGIEVGVFAHVAEFVTNVTVPSSNPDRKDHGDCALRVMESYQLAIGAAAGATVAIAGEKWGPVPQTVVPIFYTTLAGACAASHAAQPTTTTVTTTAAAAVVPPVAPRQKTGDGDLKTTTLTTKVVFTGVACRSPGLVNCPVSLQKTTKATSTRTLVTAVPPGVKATFPPTTHASVATTVNFGSRAKKLYETTGSPSSFVPQPTSSTDKVVDAVHGVDKRVIVGVSVGVGSFVIMAVAASYWLCVKRSKAKYQPVSRISQVHTSSSSDGHFASTYDPQKNRHIMTVERDVR
ncbi:glycolate oxidase [Apiospora arundinis]|uniref:Glycolate oxidase n=1 Tax=Apiospora arundinis TaxID=335852 RepID=A0ABR2HKA1_9PEZI